MEFSSESKAELIPDKISEAVEVATYELFPTKVKREVLVHILFQRWNNDNNVHTTNEEVILAP